MWVHEVLRKIVYAHVFRRMKAHGTNITFSRGGIVRCPRELTVGSNVFISRYFEISAWQMSIGSNVMIGPYFLALCDDHIFDRVGTTMYSVCNERKRAPIRIGDDVWIGAHVTVLKGAVVSEGCVVGAGSVVTKTLPPYTICCGVPCKPLATRFTLEQLGEHFQTCQSALSVEEVSAAWKQAGLLP